MPAVLCDVGRARSPPGRVVVEASLIRVTLPLHTRQRRHGLVIFIAHTLLSIVKLQKIVRRSEQIQEWMAMVSEETFKDAGPSAKQNSSEDDLGPFKKKHVSVCNVLCFPRFSNISKIILVCTYFAISPRWDTSIPHMFVPCTENINWIFKAVLTTQFASASTSWVHITTLS